MSLIQTFALYLVTAVAEIIGCYLPLLWLQGRGPAWLLAPAGLSLAAFVWLLSLHPAASGRVYAAYGGVYIAVALLWLWRVDGLRPSLWDFAGIALALSGAALIVLGPRHG